MKLAELTARGAFAASGMVRKSVTWSKTDEDGQVENLQFFVFIKKLSFGLIDQLIDAKRDERSRNAVLICNGVFFGEAGDEQMAYDQAYSLDPSLASTLLNAFHEVNRTITKKEDEEKNSQPPMNSGTN